VPAGIAVAAHVCRDQPGDVGQRDARDDAVEGGLEAGEHRGDVAAEREPVHADRGRALGARPRDHGARIGDRLARGPEVHAGVGTGERRRASGARAVQRQHRVDDVHPELVKEAERPHPLEIDRGAAFLRVQRDEPWARAIVVPEHVGVDGMIDAVGAPGIAAGKAGGDRVVAREADVLEGEGEGTAADALDLRGRDGGGMEARRVLEPARRGGDPGDLSEGRETALEVVVARAGEDEVEGRE
jgi:hypothetical protein